MYLGNFKSCPNPVSELWSSEGNKPQKKRFFFPNKNRKQKPLSTGTRAWRRDVCRYYLVSGTTPSAPRKVYVSEGRNSLWTKCPALTVDQTKRKVIGKCSIVHLGYDHPQNCGTVCLVLDFTNIFLFLFRVRRRVSALAKGVLSCTRRYCTRRYCTTVCCTVAPPTS